MSLKDRSIHLIYRTATGSRKVRLLITPIVALSYFLFASLFVILSFPADRLLGLPDLLPPLISAVLSIPIIFLGLFLAFWSVLHFIRVKGTPVPFNPPPELIISGPYAYTRNPMLSGLFILLFGLGIASRSVALFFIFTPLSLFVNN